MSAPYAAIRSAFTIQLQAFPSLPFVAWEGVHLPPPPGEIYVAPFLLPGEVFQAEIGTAGNNRHTGIYQVSIYAPDGEGLSAIEAMRDSLIDHFKRGTTITYGAVSVKIVKAYPGPIMHESGWQHIPITIQFRSDVSN